MSSKNALVSVYNKAGVDELGNFLFQNNYTIFSTGGTYKKLSQLKHNNNQLIEISEYTGSPEICDGRVKTLHPKVFGGILGLRKDPSHQHDISNIIKGIFFDMVVVNLYPFEETLKTTNREDEILEQIDIGGHTLIRAAVKNYKDVTILTHPSQYLEFIKNPSKEENYIYAKKAIKHIMDYDIAINNWFNAPNEIGVSYEFTRFLKYGLNPYMEPSGVYLKGSSGNSKYEILNGNPGYINLLDANNAIRLVLEVREHLGMMCACSFKHNSPAGVAILPEDSNPFECFLNARNIDPKSSFGDFIGFSHNVDINLADTLKRFVSDGIIAYDYSPEALECLKTKKKGNYCVLKQKELPVGIEFRDVNGETLMQPNNTMVIKKDELEKHDDIPKHVYTDIMLGFITLKYTQSNSICFVYNGNVIGVGAGQQNRVDCIEIAGKKASDWLTRNNIIIGETMPHITMVSDAFCPFEDNVEAAHKYHARYIAQPGGSIRDNEIEKRCEELGIIMFKTGKRAFTH